MKKMTIYIFILFLIIFIPTNVRAAGIMDNIINSGDNFLNMTATRQRNMADGSVVTENIIDIDESKLRDSSNDIYNILLYSGIALSVLIGAVLGIQFVTSSVEDKAKVKEALIPYIVGCVVIFGAFGFWKLAISLLNNI